MNGIESTLNEQAAEIYRLKAALQAIVDHPITAPALVAILAMKRIAREARQATKE